MAGEKKGTLDKASAALALGNLNVIGEESEEEDREDEIKELLARAFSVETLGDDADEDDAEDSGEEHLDDVDSGIVRQKMFHPDQNSAGEIREPVSLFHGSHCPGEGDRNGNYDNVWATGDGETLTELKTYAEFRERQAQRAQEEVATLSKEKRALAHQLALLKTEALAIKSTEEELRKTISLKEEQNDFFKEKVNEILRQYEAARKSENETKDYNIRLQAQIEKLQQEAKLLSAIGLQTKESDLNDALRQTRQKHELELNSWRNKVAELEHIIQKHQHQELAQPRKNEFEHTTKMTIEEAQTQTTFDVQAEVKTERERHAAEKELWMKHLASLEERLRELIIRRQDCKSIQIQTSPQAENLTMTLDNSKKIEVLSVEVQTDNVIPPLNASNIRGGNSETVEVQTEETMETYRILGSLIESWIIEVTEAEERAVKSESEVAELTKGLRTLKVRFRMLKKLVVLCRKEWSIRENALLQRWNASEERFRNFLEALGEGFAVIDKCIPARSGKSRKRK